MREATQQQIQTLNAGDRIRRLDQTVTTLANHPGRWFAVNLVGDVPVGDVTDGKRLQVLREAACTRGWDIEIRHNEDDESAVYIRRVG